MTTLIPPISIFAYDEYRHFLKDYYDRAHAMDRKFSHRFIAGRLGVSSSGWFADLLKGRTNLTGTHVVKLASLMKLKEAEAGYFESLVQFSQAGSMEERNHHLRKLLSFKERKMDLVGREKFDFYSTWYYAAIRELLFFHRFENDYTSLAKKLDPPIQPHQAKKAIQLLEKLGFIRKDAQGCWRSLDSTLKKDSSFRSQYAANLLRTNMELGMVALEKFQKEERHISAMTLSLSGAGFEKAQAHIESLRKKLVALMEEDPGPEKVFQLNLQFFPITP